MKIMNYIMLSMFLVIISSACSSQPTQEEPSESEFDERIEIQQLDSIRAELQKAIPNVPVDLYRKAIAMHLQFAEHNKDDAFAPVALDYAQGYAEQIQDLRSSIMYINRILNEYPDYKGKQMLMFNKATHHDFLRDTLEARLAYEEYLKTFPNISKDEKEEIKEMIKMIPYTLEERIKMQSGK